MFLAHLTTKSLTNFAFGSQRLLPRWSSDGPRCATQHTSAIYLLPRHPTGIRKQHQPMQHEIARSLPGTYKSGTQKRTLLPNPRLKFQSSFHIWDIKSKSVHESTIQKSKSCLVLFPVTCILHPAKVQCPCLQYCNSICLVVALQGLAIELCISAWMTHRNKPTLLLRCRSLSYVAKPCLWTTGSEDCSAIPSHHQSAWTLYR